jgi:hypothetical protein
VEKHKIYYTPVEYIYMEVLFLYANL